MNASTICRPKTTKKKRAENHIHNSNPEADYCRCFVYVKSLKACCENIYQTGEE